MAALIVSVVVAALSVGATRNLYVAGAMTFSFLAAVLLIHGFSGFPAVFLYAGGASVAAFLSSVFGGVATGAFRRDPQTELKLWRVLARPFALLFIPIEVLWGSRPLLVLVGLVAAVFIASDLVRIFSNIHFEQLYKRGERKKFSSMTAFLVSVFVIFLLFPAPISHLSLALLTVGDLSAKLIGRRFGRTKLMERRTLEGSLGFAVGSLASGYLLYLLLPYPILYLVVGTVSATAIELFSKDVEDNLTVGLLTGVILSVLKLFFRV